ncbi:capsular polysaccharide biosynthesis protein [Alicyclobacillus cellulosilyticus]|uniref:Capsular polysaccharide biosynthesis protein n=1 Tax=Alicyclobacillus cellulosilyticus TaxID=1003997 RepID=A0A917NJ63_9BACL|nr:Wzz/FepE/Etk N-terminal domain-containing protein [Alicyclobacillus cellulosilyticus]GGJ04809.1 capsular polysaccharide biosynthesis protein [Alicyclobacillus cellulosilyticus]
MEEIELRAYWAIIRKRWVLVITIPLIAALVSALVSIYLLKPQYEADTTLLVNQQNQANQNAALDYQGIIASQALVNTYSDIIRSQTVERTVIQQLHLPYSVKELDSMIKVTAPNQSQVITLSVTAPSQPLAVRIANTLARVFQVKAQDWMTIKNVQIIDPAVVTPDAKPVKPNKKLNVAVAFILGLMVSVGLAFLLEYLDYRIRTEEEVQQYLGLPVLGTVMEYNGD